MANWIHCNVCCTLSVPNSKIFITNCGHLICESCSRSKGSSNCPKCSQECEMLIIDGNLPPAIKGYFIPQQKIFQELSKTIQQSISIVEFQEKNKANILKILQQKYKIAKNEINKLRNENQKLKMAHRLMMKPSLDVSRGSNSNSVPHNESMYSPSGSILSQNNSIQLSMTPQPQHMITGEASRNNRNNVLHVAPQRPQTFIPGERPQCERSRYQHHPVHHHLQQQQQPVVNPMNIHRYQLIRQRTDNQRPDIHRQSMNNPRISGSSHYPVSNLSGLDLMD